MADISYEQFQDIVRNAPAGVTKQQLAKELLARGHKFTEAGTAGTPPAVAEPQGPLEQFGQGFVRNLPMIGATLGTALLTPAGMPLQGLALGGAAGRAAQQGVETVAGVGPASPLEALTQQGSSAASQSLIGAGPEAALAAARPLAERFMATALAPRVVEPLNAARAALAERIGPGFLRRFPKQVRGRAEATAAEQGRVLDEAAARGKWHDAQQTIKEIKDSVFNPPKGSKADRQLRAMSPGQRNDFEAWVDNEFADYVDPASGKVIQHMIDPLTLAAKRSKFGTEAGTLLRKTTGGDYVPTGEAVPKSWRAAAGGALSRRLHAAHPELIPIDARLSRLAHLREPARREAIGTSSKVFPWAPAAGAGLAGAAVIPAHSWQERAAHAVALGAAASPQALSNYALFLTNPALAPFVTNLLRASTTVGNVAR